MKLTTKGHYGIHAMMNLGARYGQGAVLLRDLCRPLGFSEKYLEQLLRSLRHAGLVESVRGARGGYWLAREPERITLLEIVEALEGDLGKAPSGCKTDCQYIETCAVLKTWEAATKVMRGALGQVTLADLLRRQLELDRENAPPDFSI